MAKGTDFAACILAAGKGKRMKSDLPKVLHLVRGVPMVELVVRAAADAGSERTVVVVGHQADLVRGALGERVVYAVQEEQLGTGHAVDMARSQLEGVGTILVLCGDTPLVTGETLRSLVATHQEAGAAATMVSTIVDNPTGYGRVVREGGLVRRIVEEADASSEEKIIREINAGIYVFKAENLWEALDNLQANNVQGEFYLTDCIGAMVRRGLAVVAMTANPEEVAGVNNPDQLARAEATLEKKAQRG